MIRPGRLAVLALLLVGTFGSAGCLGTAIQAVAAPQSLAANAAGQAATSTGNAVASALGPAPAYEQTIQDLDRIIAEHGDDDQADNLRALRERISQERGPTAAHSPPWPAPPSEFDRRLDPEAKPVPRAIYTSGSGLMTSIAPFDRGPQLIIEPPIDPGYIADSQRQEGVPYMPPRTSSLPDQPPRHYLLDSRPVRLEDQPQNRHE